MARKTRVQQLEEEVASLKDQKAELERRLKRAETSQQRTSGGTGYAKPVSTSKPGME